MTTWSVLALYTLVEACVVSVSVALRSAHVQADHVAAAERAVGSAGTPRAHRQQAHLSAVRHAVRRVAPFSSAAVRVARLVRVLNDSMRLCACRELLADRTELFIDVHGIQVSHASLLS